MMLGLHLSYCWKKYKPSLGLIKQHSDCTLLSYCSLTLGQVRHTNLDSMGVTTFPFLLALHWPKLWPIMTTFTGTS